ncbi:MAG TPA: helix-turn-helix domain-containing protein [Arsenophonus nasoniae]|uniref:helix-turn-helix domain-containing protein n=1 Tax=Arsenophonus nasoniae TaxID=638 RepID=UPI003879D4F1
MVAKSSDYSKKLLALRKLEGLTQMRFSAITGISLGTLKNYETGQKPARAEVMEKVLKTEMFKKYTMWLLHDEDTDASNQITPILVNCESDLLKASPKTRKKKYALNNVKEDDNTLVINSIVKNMTDEERLELAKLLSKEGFRLLLKLLDPDNQSLLNLPDKKKRAALRLESMDDEQFREILSKIEGNTDLPQEEMNVFTKKTVG